MTIYDLLSHMGHARMMMVVRRHVYRWLRALGCSVTYVRNITDIEDKIIKRALERGITDPRLTDEMIDAMRTDLAPSAQPRRRIEPRATDYVPQMVSMIAHAREQGSGLPCDRRRRQLRGSQVCRLRQALWQVDRRAACRRARRGGRREGRSARLRAVEGGQTQRTGGRAVRQPYGPGATGLAHRVLGDEPRAAGRDVRHPRRRHGPAVPAPRERDRADAKGALGKPFVRYWLHNGFLTVDNEKMSKSLGNFFAIRDVLKRYDGETLRFSSLRTHYRSPFNFQRRAPRRRAGRAGRGCTTALQSVPPRHCGARLVAPAGRGLPRGDERRLQHARRRWRCCSDSAGEANRTRDGALTALIRNLAATLGSCSRSRAPTCKAARRSTRQRSSHASPARAKAKAARDFALADSIRDDCSLCARHRARRTRPRARPGSEPERAGSPHHGRASLPSPCPSTGMTPAATSASATG